MVAFFFDSWCATKLQQITVVGVVYLKSIQEKCVSLDLYVPHGLMT